MIVSSRGRYALRVVLDLAEHPAEGYVPMKIIAERQGISQKYLEQIVPVLSKNGLIEATHGKGGGYKLIKSPEEYTVGEILRLTEGELDPVSCQGMNSDSCEHSGCCKTLKMWQDFSRLTNDYFNSITIADLMGE